MSKIEGDLVDYLVFILYYLYYFVLSEIILCSVSLKKKNRALMHFVQLHSVRIKARFFKKETRRISMKHYDRKGYTTKKNEDQKKSPSLLAHEDRMKDESFSPS